MCKHRRIEIAMEYTAVKFAVRLHGTWLLDRELLNLVPASIVGPPRGPEARKLGVELNLDTGRGTRGMTRGTRTGGGTGGRTSHIF
eukprot:SAG31_NODE_342_length_17455_cov_6.381251_9_plen_86_part_00